MRQIDCNLNIVQLRYLDVTGHSLLSSELHLVEITQILK